MAGKELTKEAGVKACDGDNGYVIRTVPSSHYRESARLQHRSWFSLVCTSCMMGSILIFFIFKTVTS